MIPYLLPLWPSHLRFGKEQHAEFVLQNPLGMPRVSRTMNQVQQLSERMVSKVQHRDATTDGLASARLLAQQGLNQRQYVLLSHIAVASMCCFKDELLACRLSKALNKFEMKPTYEDVYQTQHPNVEEYLKHVQQSTLLSAIQVCAYAHAADS